MVAPFAQYGSILPCKHLLKLQPQHFLCCLWGFCKGSEAIMPTCFFIYAQPELNEITRLLEKYCISTMLFDSIGNEADKTAAVLRHEAWPVKDLPVGWEQAEPAIVRELDVLINELLHFMRGFRVAQHNSSGYTIAVQQRTKIPQCHHLTYMATLSKLAAKQAAIEAQLQRTRNVKRGNAHNMREEAIQMLQLCPATEGIWSVDFAARLCNTIVAMEEHRAAAESRVGSELVSDLLPRHCRVAYYSFNPRSESEPITARFFQAPSGPVCGPEVIKPPAISNSEAFTTDGYPSMRSIFIVPFVAVLSVVLPALAVKQSRRIDEHRFASVDELFNINRHIGGAGLRGTASSRQNALIEWLDKQLQGIDGVKLTYNSLNLVRWEPRGDNLYGSASLKVHIPGACSSALDVAGATPYTRLTNGEPVTAEMLYIPETKKITSFNATNKIVIRDVTFDSVPFPLLFAISNYRTPDMSSLANASYARPYTASFNQEIIDATSAGAVGIIFMWNVSHKYVQSYFDPHEGTMYRIPGAFVGAEVATILKDAASQGFSAELDVHGEMGPSTSKEIFATLPGLTSDTILITSHTDGNTWIQDNGVSGVLALARYFAAQPLSSRNKTLQFVFTSSHLHYSTDGNFDLARSLDRSYDHGNTTLVFALEHMGAREILPIDREGKSDQDLAYTGHGEVTLWAVGPSDALRAAIVDSVKYRKLDRMSVMPGIGLPNSSVVPEYQSFGGIGTSYHQNLIPTAAIVSGPWSLWAPYFGADAIDFERLRMQLLAVGDVLLNVDMLSREEIAGGYLKYREQRAAGKPSFQQRVIPEFAP
ncbi:hypothetical protein NLG97_g6664 [Lecanicillium saksenae]|uniref:Uncharacterized protein n=1 Tax=Lecanicillium saksenae TaxID=468837 RepID=A0ACC1QP00_9HYPO|nr:hypothetical protein NLG97_g6664 [Lecanicillium saksenae]